MEKILIKVIATDLDGTLLGDDHKLDQDTFEAIQEAKACGIRMIIATGREYVRAQAALGKYEFECDYIVASGAEVRDSRGNILTSIPMDKKNLPEIMSIIQQEHIIVRFCGRSVDYVIGTEEDARQQVAAEAKLFFGQDGMADEATLLDRWMRVIGVKIQCVDSLETLMEMDDLIFKVFAASDDLAKIERLKRALAEIHGVAVASSFPENLELTNIAAQKGPVLAEYIQNLGYSMDEVMVLGDSMNDYSMLSMEFGATVAMENAMDEVKKAAKFVTKRNSERGAAYAIRAAIMNHNGMLEHLEEMLGKNL